MCGASARYLSLIGAAEDIVELLHSTGAVRAAIIGEVTHEHPGKVLLRSSIGGHRVVNYLTGEQLPRIC